MNRFTISSVLCLVLFGMGSCTTDENSPGLEYMPDMYRSPAIEAYVDYGMDPYHYTEELALEQRNTLSAKLPVPGSIANHGENMNFNLPYAYENTTEGYEAAGTTLKSPLSANQAILEEGMEIYIKMCSHCHGEKGAGDGAISRNGKIKGIPSYTDKLKDLPEGKMYHTLQYGKGLMGSHASQMSQKDRWMVVEYIKVLQQGGEMPSFDENGNIVKEAAPVDEPAAVVE